MDDSKAKVKITDRFFFGRFFNRDIHCLACGNFIEYQSTFSAKSNPFPMHCPHCGRELTNVTADAILKVEE